MGKCVLYDRMKKMMRLLSVEYALLRKDFLNVIKICCDLATPMLILSATN